LKLKKIHNTEDNSYQKLYTKLGTVFNSPEWITVYGKELELIGIYNDNQELIGCFYVYKSSKLGLSYIVNPPFSPNNALIFINPAEGRSNRISFEKSIHSNIAEWFKKQNAKLCVSSFPYEFSDMQEYFWREFKVIPHYTYRLSLRFSEKDLFLNMSAEKRKSIRKAEKDNITARLENNAETIINLVKKTFHRKNKRFNLNLASKIITSFLSNGKGYAFVSSHNGKDISCNFCIHDKHTAFYLFGGYDAESKHHGAGVLSMWECIKHAKKLNLSVYDFEGSMLPEVEKYFRDFGGDLIPYFTINKAGMPFEMALKIKKRNTF
jgi:lipid II:glycine glycyltransferase (peptidoglycan interpeptide bridge formation enzyme)